MVLPRLVSLSVAERNSVVFQDPTVEFFASSAVALPGNSDPCRLRLLKDETVAALPREKKPKEILFIDVH